MTLVIRGCQNNRVYHMVYLTDAVLKDGIYVSEGLCEDGKSYIINWEDKDFDIEYPSSISLA